MKVKRNLRELLPSSFVNVGDAQGVGTQLWIAKKKKKWQEKSNGIKGETDVFVAPTNNDVLKSDEKGILYGIRRSIMTTVESQTSGVHEKQRFLDLQKPAFS